MRTLRVALLGHASTHEEFTYAFGLYRIAAFCRAIGLPHPIEIFDRDGDGDEAEDFERLRAASPDVIGLSAFIWSLPKVVRLVSRIRRELSGVLVVVGGPSAAGFEELAIDDTRPDLLVLGFGERTFAAILEAHAEGRLVERAAELGRVISWLRGRAEPLGQAHLDAVLDVLPSPYLDGLVDPRGRTTLYVETDRGCPYSCAFCIESTASPKVSRFSIERIAAELQWALDHGIVQIELCSAILNLDTAWLQSFVEMVERVDPERRLELSAALYTNHLDARQAELFGRLRMKSALFGLNTINPATFAGVRRRIDPDRFRASIELFARHGRPQVSMIMGLPGDTPDGLRETLRFAESLPADLMLFRLMVLPSTIYYEQRTRLQLDIDYQHDNRIRATHSYDADDLARMEAIAAAAGFDEVNPGEWVRRRDRERFEPPPAMPRRRWNLLYLALRAMDLAAQRWPDGWHHVRVFLDRERFAGVTLAGPAGAQLSIYLTQADAHDRPPPFHRSRFFELTARMPHRRERVEPPASVLAAFAAAFEAAERSLLESRAPARVR